MCNKNARMEINVQLAGKCAKIPVLISPLSNEGKRTDHFF